MTLSTVTVVGAGRMGAGIAQVFALAGLDVTIADVSPEAAGDALDQLVWEAGEFETQGLFPEGSADLVGRHVTAAESIPDSVQDADFIVEAVFERVDVKHDVLATISQHARADAIIATNTSTIPVKELAPAVVGPERFLTAHFIYPAPFIPGVELVRGEATTEETLEAVEDLLTFCGKQHARVADAPGMVMNRLQHAMIKEACTLVDEGVATIEDVDTIVRSTFGVRLGFFGPFGMIDQGGLDIHAACYATYERTLGERLATPRLLKEAVESGRLGVKNGQGLRGSYDERTATELATYRNLAYARMSQLQQELGDAPDATRG